jgi:hypothetical protein
MVMYRDEQSQRLTSHHHVFIGGLHRSGTTVLYQCLREHPQISGFRDTGVPEDEGQHLQTVYPPGKAYGGPGWFGFYPAAHLTETADLVSDENRRRLFEQWALHWDLNKPVLLEKSPPNLIRTRFLQALYPGSSFIVATRHPVAVSLATQKWSGTSLPELLEHWLVCHETFEQDRPHVRRLLTLSYEEFVESPRATLSRIYAFLGLSEHENQVEVRSHGNDRYLEQWRQLRKTGASEACLLDSPTLSEYESRVAPFGYSLFEV